MNFLTKLKKPKAARMLGGALGLLLALSLVLVPTPALAVQGIPHWFNGTVTIDSELAPMGTIISAQIDGVQYGDPTKGESYGTVDADSRYGEDPLFYVPADDPDTLDIKEGGVAGETVEFYITNLAMDLDGVKANEVALFENFGVTEFPLTLTIPDITVPTVTIDDIADYINVLAQISGTASDNVALDKVQVSIGNTTDSVFWNGTDWLSATEVWLDATDTETWTYTMPALTSANSYQVRAKAIDTSTNESTVALDGFTFDTTAPTVTTVSPVDGATEVEVDAVVSATFSEDIDEGTLIFTLDDILGTLSYDSITKIASFTPDANFDYEITYTANVQASDLAGNPLAEAEVWSFITATEAVGPVSFIFTLPAGWNLLSTPIKLDADSDTMEQILGESLANIEASWRWDVQNQQWAIPTGYELSPLEAVYLKVSTGASATAEFVPYPDYSELPSRELQPGLNLIGSAPALGEAGFPDMPLDQALISIAEAEGDLTGYTMVVSPALNQLGWAYALGGEIEDLVPFKGYWVVMENADTLFGFSYTPTP